MKKIVNLFCFIGCSIQIYWITCTYLKFKVRSEVTYDYSDQGELPAIDIIIPMAMTINLTELFIRYPEQMTDLCNRKYLNIVNYTGENFIRTCSYKIKKFSLELAWVLQKMIKVKDIKELTIDPRKQINYIQIGNSNFITNLCNLTRYYNGVAVFLRISCTEQTALIADNMNIVGSNGEHMATIGHSFGELFGIRFSSQFDMPVEHFWQYKSILQEADEITPVWLRYGKIVSRSLPYPYESNCRYYNKMKVLHDCIANFTFYQGFLSATVVNEWDSQSEHMGFIDNIKALHQNSSCTTSIPAPECEKFTYSIAGGIASEQVNYSSGLIFIEQPETPIMHFNVHPNLLLSEYLIFVGSIIGTWFGIAIYHSLISMLTLKGGEVIAKIRKGRESKMQIKIFTVRKSYSSDPLLHARLHSSRSPLHFHRLIHLETRQNKIE